MKKLTAYVVFEKGYEYNDEIYHLPDVSGGDPKRVTFSKEDAKNLITVLSRDSFRGLDIGNYTYDLKDVVDEISLKEIFKINKWKWDEDNLTVPEKATDEQIDEVMKFIDLQFYDFQEVEMDIASMRNAKIEIVES
jgi:hypothetical protein